eukprot:GHVH01017119.1.p1 GENE.GHVH01017119.1~~GHVH01017119.1.p1  ORF type:complete len:546 (+),score=68.25 GHVH01017119.1:2405-4042(+)
MSVKLDEHGDFSEWEAVQKLWDEKLVKLDEMIDGLAKDREGLNGLMDRLSECASKPYPKTCEGSIETQMIIDELHRIVNSMGPQELNQISSNHIVRKSMNHFGQHMSDLYDIQFSQRVLIIWLTEQLNNTAKVLSRDHNTATETPSIETRERGSRSQMARSENDQQMVKKINTLQTQLEQKEQEIFDLNIKLGDSENRIKELERSMEAYNNQKISVCSNSVDCNQYRQLNQQLLQSTVREHRELDRIIKYCNQEYNSPDTLSNWTSQGITEIRPYLDRVRTLLLHKDVLWYHTALDNTKEMSVCNKLDIVNYCQMVRDLYFRDVQVLTEQHTILLHKFFGLISDRSGKSITLDDLNSAYPFPIPWKVDDQSQCQQNMTNMAFRGERGSTLAVQMSKNGPTRRSPRERSRSKSRQASPSAHSRQHSRMKKTQVKEIFHGGDLEVPLVDTLTAKLSERSCNSQKPSSDVDNILQKLSDKRTDKNSRPRSRSKEPRSSRRRSRESKDDSKETGISGKKRRSPRIDQLPTQSTPPLCGSMSTEDPDGIR